MAQFSVYKNNDPRTKAIFPYLVDVQTVLLEGLNTTVVIPLSNKTTLTENAISKLCPTIVLNNREFILFTQQMAGISRQQLGREITNLSGQRDIFIAAIDFLITGI